MKSNARTKTKRSDSTDRQGGWNRPERTVSQTELSRALGGRGDGTGPRGGRPFLSWTGGFRAWLSARLGNLIATGYEDETGFHYGQDPANEGNSGIWDGM
jgi:hypothetical protein